MDPRDREQADSSGWERVGSGGSEQKGKRTHGHGQQCRDCWGEEYTRGLSGNGKKYNKD